MGACCNFEVPILLFGSSDRTDSHCPTLAYTSVEHYDAQPFGVAPRCCSPVSWAWVDEHAALVARPRWKLVENVDGRGLWRWLHGREISPGGGLRDGVVQQLYLHPRRTHDPSYVPAVDVQGCMHGRRRIRRMLQSTMYQCVDAGEGPAMCGL